MESRATAKVGIGTGAPDDSRNPLEDMTGAAGYMPVILVAPYKSVLLSRSDGPSP
jgi:hypothetical protein